MANVDRLTFATLLTLVLALFVAQSGCSGGGSDDFEKKLTDLLPNQELRESISKYLDLVPSTHKSRSHTSRLLKITITKKITITRIISLAKIQDSGSNSTNLNKTVALTPTANTYANHLKEFASHIFSQKPKCKSCSKCPPKRQQVCPPCKECPACPAGEARDCKWPKGCLGPDMFKDKCVTPPDCSYCTVKDDKPNVNPTPKASESKATKNSRDGLSEPASSGKNETTVPPEILRVMKAITDSEKASLSKDKHKRDLSGQPKADSDCPCRKNSSVKGSSTTKKPINSKSSTTPIPKEPKKKARSEKNIHKSNPNETFPNGAGLFDENIDLIFKTKTLRIEVMKVFDEIPEKYGGKDSALAEKILSSFGEDQAESKKSYMRRDSRSLFKAVMGHLMELAIRLHCSCDRCSLYPSCKCNTCPNCVKCPMKFCPTGPGCPNHHVCWCSEGWDSEPPTRTVTKEEDVSLDDVDPENPIKSGELEKVQACKGFTCAFNKTCGRADLNALTPRKKQSGYIVGGKTIKYGEFPQFVKLDILLPQDDSNVVGICGGVLISNQHVLTAGHCVQIPVDDKYVKVSAKDITVTLADFKADKKDEHEEKRKVSKICFSSKWVDPNGEGSRYDYAILTLDKEVKFNDYIQPACLPYNMKGSALNKAKCYVVGLGVIKNNGKKGQAYAKKVQSLRLKPASCKSWGVKEDDRSRHCFSKFQNAGGDTCSGDSGGPIVCAISGAKGAKRWTVAGLVSYGSENCDGQGVTGWVAVYTRVQGLLEDMNKDCQV